MCRLLRSIALKLGASAVIDLFLDLKFAISSLVSSCFLCHKGRMVIVLPAPIHLISLVSIYACYALLSACLEVAVPIEV